MGTGIEVGDVWISATGVLFAVLVMTIVLTGIVIVRRRRRSAQQMAAVGRAAGRVRGSIHPPDERIP